MAGSLSPLVELGNGQVEGDLAGFGQRERRRRVAAAPRAGGKAAETPRQRLRPRPARRQPDSVPGHGVLAARSSTVTWVMTRKMPLGIKARAERVGDEVR